MFGKLLGEILATPVRIVEAVAAVADNLTDSELGDVTGINDVAKGVHEGTGSVADAISDGVSETIDGD